MNIKVNRSRIPTAGSSDREESRDAAPGSARAEQVHSANTYRQLKKSAGNHSSADRAGACVDEHSSPALRGDRYFFEKRLASETQASIYVREGWKGTDNRLIDATKLSSRPEHFRDH